MWKLEPYFRDGFIIGQIHYVYDITSVIKLLNGDDETEN